MTSKDGSTCLFIVWECIVQSFFLLLQNFFFSFLTLLWWRWRGIWFHGGVSSAPLFLFGASNPKAKWHVTFLFQSLEKMEKVMKNFWYCQKILVFFSMLDFSASEASNFCRISYTSKARPFLVTFTHCETLFLWIWSFGRGPFWSLKCAFKPQFTV